MKESPVEQLSPEYDILKVSEMVLPSIINSSSCGCACGWQREHDKMQSQFFDLKVRLEEERASRQHEAEMSSEEVEQAQVSRQREGGHKTKG